ncbi:MAG TPA: hypothetical protein VGK29_09200 [Paludibaculum sp.]|jgi:hypothetical protein
MRALVLLFASAALLCAGEADALRIDAELRDRHLPYSTIIDPVFQSPDTMEIAGYTRCGDSAIWTGHYLAAQSYRWAVTRSPEARTNVMEALNGIRKLLDVTGTDVLARCAVPIDSPWAAGIASEEAPNQIRAGVIDQQNYLWAGRTSRDQYSGVFFGLTAAWNLVDDQEVHDWVSMLATRMLDRLLADHWLVRMPDGEISTTFIGRADQQLSLLKLGRRCNPNRFESSYKSLANLAANFTVVPIAIEAADPYNSYFKFNLDHINFWNLLTSGDSWWVRIGYQAAFHTLRNATWEHQNAFFDVIETAIEGHDDTRDQRIRDNLDAWLQRQRRDFWVDLRPTRPSCGDDDNRACEVVPVIERTPTDFLWQRSPFQLYGGLYGTVEGAGIDYILPYWMARYHGVLGPDPQE